MLLLIPSNTGLEPTRKGGKNVNRLLKNSFYTFNDRLALIEPVKIAVMEPLKKLQKRFRTPLSNQVFSPPLRLIQTESLLSG